MEIASSRISLVKSRLGSILEKKQNALRSGNPFVYSDLELAPASLLEEKSDIELEIEYLKKWKETTDNELDLLFEKALANTREMISVLGSTPHPLVSYLMRILRTPDDFISFHAQTPDSYSLIKYRGLTFIGLADESLKSELYSTILENEKKDRGRFFDTQTSDIRNPWKDSQKKHEEKKEDHSSSREKSYDNEKTASKTRWFSEAALHDGNVLKKEYHLLIKRYHPDETGDDSGLEILKEIIEEKDMILRDAL
jgi:hypothetical protein